MRLNRTSELKAMTILISWELSLFNFERLYMWCAWIGHPSEKLWQFEFLESFLCLILSVSIYYTPESNLSVKRYDHLNLSRASVVEFRACWHIMRPNRTSVWKVMTVWISWELPLSNFERLDMWRTRIGHPSEKLCTYNFSTASAVQFRASWYIMCLNRTSELKVMTISISRELPLFNFEGLDMWCP